MELRRFFEENPKAALGFSGGTDSSYLLYAAKKYGADVRPYYIKTPFQPEFEYNDAKRLAEELGTELFTVEYDILSDKEITENTALRCYFCKRAIFSVLAKRARRDGYGLIIDGTNASDSAAERPGIKALAELSVRSPLRECGISKAEVRRLSEEAGLFTAAKPSYSCLATRVPTGTKITRSLLRNTELAEDYLFSLGFSDFRVRHYDGCALLQLKPEQFIAAAELRGKIADGLSPYFDKIFLDLEARG